MRIGVPKEIKVQEHRVGLVPATVRELAAHGHTVLVERCAGGGIGVSDEHYQAAGATILLSAAEVWDGAELIVKVKEPQAEERASAAPGPDAVHLPPSRARSRAGARPRGERGHLHRLRDGHRRRAAACRCSRRCPKSPGACRSRLAPTTWKRRTAGLGVLLGGVPGVDPAKVVVLGGGVVGTHAIHIALGMGADVWVLDRNVDVLRRLWAQFGRPLNTVFSTRDAVERHVVAADLVIGGVLIPGASAPKLVSADLVRRMRPGAVLVDVAIDQGGCFETSRPTTHDDPVYAVGGVVHYCVANMPGGVPRTSTFALNNATLPFVLALADKGPIEALRADPHLRAGLNVHAGQVTHPAVAEALGYPFVDPLAALERAASKPMPQ